MKVVIEKPGDWVNIRLHPQFPESPPIEFQLSKHHVALVVALLDAANKSGHFKYKFEFDI